jgi:predicted MFS family arabinose efflux permease
MNIWRAAFAASAAGLICIGVARLAYPAMIPALIEAQWFSSAAIIYFGAANLAGYLGGALVARSIVRFVPPALLLRAMMVMVTVSFFASAAPLSWSWYFAWRFLSGVGGAIVMVVAAPTVLSHVARERRGMVSGVIFAGVGSGVAISGVLVPLFLRWGLVETWCGLGVLAAILTVAAWGGFPRDAVAGEAPSRQMSVRRWGGIVVLALLIEYALNASAQVPHMVFLVDFIARGLGRGIEVGGWYWVIYGVGAIVGPLVLGRIADRIGFGLTLRAALAAEAVSVALVVMSHDGIVLGISAFLLGAFTPGLVVVVMGRVQELVADPERQRTVWAAATTAFAIGQAASGYFYSYLFVASGGVYAWLYAIGAGMAVVALTIDFAAARTSFRLSRRPA